MSCEASALPGGPRAQPTAELLCSLLAEPGDVMRRARSTRRWASLLDADEVAYHTLEPAREPRTEALPDDLDPAVVSALVGLRDHRALPASGRGVGGRRPRRGRDRDHGHGVREVPGVHAAGARRDRPRAEGARALPVPDESAGAGSGPLAGRLQAARPCGRRSTTGTRRRSGAGRCGSGRTRCSRTRTCSTSACSRATTAGATCCTTCAGSWWTRRTCTAACSAPTWPTSCGACAGWRAHTEPTRSSCSRRRRSRTRASSPRRSPAGPPP